jgi:cell division protein FtsQ
MAGSSAGSSAGAAAGARARPGRTVSPISARRYLARARSRRRLALRLMLTVFVVLTVLGGAAWLLLESGQVAVRHLEITGLHRLDRTQVERSAGITVGEPLILIDTEATARRIAGDLPIAASVQVTRGWPRTVRVAVRERVAVAGVRTGGRVQLLDRDGVMFALDNRLPAGVTPIVAAASVDADAAGADAAGADAAARAVTNAAVVVAALPLRVREQVEEVTAHSPHAIDLTLRDGRLIHWGGPERSSRKAAVLQALMSHSADEYDVSAPDAPTTRG